MAFKNIAKRKKKAPRVSRDYDTLHMGDEPKWDKMPSDENRKVAIMRAQSWYNYFHTSKDHRPFVVKYAKEELGFDRRKASAIENAGQFAIPVFVEKYIRMFYRGWVLSDSEAATVKTNLERVFEESLQSKPSEVEKVVSNTVNSPLLAELDEWEDAVIDGKINEVDIFERQKVLNDTKSNVEKHVKPWVLRRLEDMKLALEDTEGYEHMKKRDINKMISLLDKMSSDIDLILATKVRKVRAKTLKVSAPKMIKNFKHLKTSEEFKVSSIDPTTIIGARTLYMFDTKYRTLHIVIADRLKGFEASGMAVKNVDESKSYKIRLRKPEEVLPTVVSKSETQITKALKELTTKPAQTNARTNANMILLRVIK